MPIYIAMLRGINVGAHHRVKMDRLRASFEALGFEKAQTYIQSGNVVFKAAKASTPMLSKKIEDRFLKDFGFSVAVITRTHKELADVIKNNPFLKEQDIDTKTLHVCFLAENPAPPELKELAGLTKAPDRSHCAGAEIYLHLPNGMAKSSLANNPIERRLLKRATIRNWRTVTNLMQMCVDCA
jgi:uncharacterized protein (DUF1697 family)